jgi:hypothetical protein
VDITWTPFETQNRYSTGENGEIAVSKDLFIVVRRDVKLTELELYWLLDNIKVLA